MYAMSTSSPPDSTSEVFQDFHSRQALEEPSWAPSVSAAALHHTPVRFIGRDPKVLELLELVNQVADTTATVLITGESGTGKELIARLICERSSRSKQNLVPVNCGAIPESLQESEFFGHVKGAFTGANRRKIGKLELANNGTIFLD
jgi:transcriptional regulator with GAF, ATPase, and Fis domain